MNPKSIEVQETLIRRLNRLCDFLDEEYDINSGGCCYIAYCIAKLLTSDKFKFKVLIYDYYPLDIKKFDKVIGSHFHYAISLRGGVINPGSFNTNLCSTPYSRVSASKILKHYERGSWNTDYDLSKNEFVYKTIKMFYEDLTEDLREG